MIFVTLGTHEQGFQRLIDLAEEAASTSTEAFIGQSGHTLTPKESRIGWQPFLPFERMLELYHSSRITVTHAGTGSVMTSLRTGRMPIVVPRYANLGEHVDDHQVEFTEALAQKGLVIPVYRDGSLARAIEIAKGSGAPVKLEANRIPEILSQFVRSFETA